MRNNQLCRLCGWKGREFEFGDDAAWLRSQDEVLRHVAAEHPAEFQSATGQNPEARVREYDAEMAARFGSDANG